MRQLLHVAVSPRGPDSVSRRVAAGLVAALRRADPDLRLAERDLAAAPPPHPDAAFVEACLMPEARRGSRERRLLALSERLIGELEAADLVLLSTPMHNFTVPSALKAWLDHVVRINRTFRPTAAGKVGVLADRPVFAVVACNGRFGEDAGAQADFFTPYLRYVLGSIGLSTLEVLRLEEVARGAEKVEFALAAAGRWTERLVEQHGGTAGLL